jgi:3-oxo-4-pregnene-20-carboxyl-CoA dehydrogenase alpha subunit
MMDFSLAESQQAVVGLAAQVLAEPKADAWKELAQAGLLALSVPARLGGDGLGVLEAAVLLTEIGRHARPGTPQKALATLMTGVLPVVRWGSSELQRALLPAVAAGELILTAAIREPSDPEPDPPATAVTDVPSRGGQGGSSPRVSTVSGIKVGVPYAAQAARILVAASLAPGAASPAAGAASPAAGATGVVIVNPAADGVSLTRTPSSAGQPEYTLRLDQAPVESVLGPAACARDLYQLAVAGACAVADGAVAGALALTRDHVATREQFGRPLAAFQAVSQQIAEVYIASRTLHLATLSACWRLAESRPAGADLDVAGYWCAEHAPRSVRICHHLHGGLGMDVTYPLHRFSSLVSDLVRFLGGAGYRLERQACSSI